jgi:Rrf2 family protein
MKLSEHVESALHLCLLLAALPPGRVLPAGRLAEYHALPAASVAKQMQTLMDAGLVVGTTGRAGGYRLSRAPAAISVLAVVEAIQGQGPLFQCREIRRQGPCAEPSGAYRSRCGIAAVMDDAQEAWQAVLAERTLAELAVTTYRKISPQVRDMARDWYRRRMR